MHTVEHMYHQITEPLRHLFDVLSLSAVTLALLGVLPHFLTGLATFLSVVWMAIRIYETPTVQSWLKRRRK